MALNQPKELIVITGPKDFVDWGGISKLLGNYISDNKLNPDNLQLCGLGSLEFNTLIAKFAQKNKIEYLMVEKTDFNNKVKDCTYFLLIPKTGKYYGEHKNDHKQNKYYKLASKLEKDITFLK